MNDYKKICLLALNDHRQLKRQYQKKMRSLSAYDGILLQSSLRKGTPYYYCLKKGGKRRYLGRETHEVVRKIRELRFCKKMVEILDDNIRLLREFTERYCDTDVESVRQRLPKQYIPLLTDSGLDLEWISGQIEYLYNSVPTTSLLAIREKQLHDFADFNLLIKKAS